MKLSRIDLNFADADLVLTRINDYRIMASWKGKTVGCGQEWHKSFWTHNVQDVQLAANQILMVYYGEDPTRQDKVRVGHDLTALVERHLLELGRP